jgi:hypothetical protein
VLSPYMKYHFPIYALAYVTLYEVSNVSSVSVLGFC